MSRRHGSFSRRVDLLRCGTALVGLFLLPTVGRAQQVQAPGNLILPDGRTQTQVQVTGRTTEITTTTIRGSNAYNSFSQFREAAGNTVNLRVPDKTSTLVNIVRDGPVVVDGVLNAYKNGKIGGNVVFSDSYGFVVGKNGVVNVGSLTVNTPTKEFVDGVIDKNGVINEAAAQRLINNDVPISRNGVVSIKGQVNARNGVRIAAQDVMIAPGMSPKTKLERHQRQFAATVNTKGMAQGGAIRVRNGQIVIVAAGNIGVGGRLSASGAVRLSAGRSIRVHRAAHVVARAPRDGSAGGVVQLSAGGAVRLGGSVVAKGSAQAGGSVAVSAGGKAILFGTVKADGSANAPAGRITVSAADSVSIAASAVLSANGGTGSGGTITVKAGTNLDVLDGAKIGARAGSTGDGGFVELSAKDTVRLGNFTLDVSAQSGAQGTLLVDPAKIVIGSTGTDADTSYLGNFVTNGANVDLQADQSITLASGGIIDTRRISGGVSTGDSGNVTLTAPIITIASGSKILADVSTGSAFKAGDVSLIATAMQSLPSGEASATTGITIAGEIRGGTISAIATSTAISSVLDDLPSGFGIAQLGAGTPLASLLGFTGNYLHATAEAKVSVESGAVISGSNDVTLSSNGKTIAGSLSLELSLLHPLLLSVAIGQVDSTVSTEVQAGATISAGKSLTVKAVSDSGLSISSYTFGLQGTTADAAFAYGAATVDTQAIVHSGANLDVGTTLGLTARNDLSFSVSASSSAFGNGSAGAAIAVSNTDTSVAARLGADIGSAASAKPASILVQSLSDTTVNSTSASTSVGDGAAVGIIRGAVPESLGSKSIADKLDSYVSKLTGDSLFAKFLPDSTSGPKIAGTVSVALGNQLSSASIAADVGAAAPKVYASGNVDVFSRVVDAGVRSDAASSLSSEAKPTKDSTQATVATSLAIGYGQYAHFSEAYIGDGAIVDASNVGVAARSEMPITIYWNVGSNFSEIQKAITTKLSSNFGVVSTILTNYADSSAAGQAAFAGAFSLLDVDNDTRAWIGSGAQVTARSSASTGNYSVDLDPRTGGKFDSEKVKTASFANGVGVEATTVQEAISIAGNFSWLSPLGGLGGQGPDSKAVGGSLGIDLFGSKTYAGIGEGAVVTSNGAVTVNAVTNDRIFTVSPTSGGGAGIDLNGITSVLYIDDETHASISNRATIVAPVVGVTASETVLSLGVAGAVASAQSSGAGLAAVLGFINTDTSAFVGDNRADSAGTDFASLAGYSVGFGSISADALTVYAETSGRITDLSVAAAIVSPEEGKQSKLDKLNAAKAPAGDGFGNKLKGAAANVKALPARLIQKVNGVSTSAADKLGMAQGSNAFTKFVYEKLGSGFNALKTKTNDALNEVPPATPPSEVNIAAAGSASISVLQLSTSAVLDHASVLARTPNGVAVTVQAVNDTIVAIASGAAALNLTGTDSGSTTVAAAGAFGIGVTLGNTVASITGSSIQDASALTVQALEGGQQIYIGLGLAINTSGKDAVSIAGTVSAAEVRDGVSASIDGSTITGKLAAPGDNSRAIEVGAYQSADIAIGGGSFAFGGSAGVGLAITFAQVADPTGGTAVTARVNDSSITQADRLDVTALSTSRIAVGAASIGGGPDQIGVSGAIVLNDIRPTTLAEITGSGPRATTVTVTGDVEVESSSRRNAQYDALLDGIVQNGSFEPGFDFIGAGIGRSETGAAILAVAGVVQVGKSNVGASIIYAGVLESHKALISNAVVTAGDTVSVAALDTTTIVTAAIGVGGASGAFAGTGSITINLVKTDTSATIEGNGAPTNATEIFGPTVIVTSQSDSLIGSGAGSAGISLDGGGVGLSIVSATIDNSIAATIDGAKVTALLDVEVSGSSKATIGTLAVSVGAGEVAGVAGSVTANIELTSVKASITGGADVFSQGNVVVLASNRDAITTLAGSVGFSLEAVGIGLSTVVDIVRSTTIASIDGVATKVDALGSTAGRLINTGDLAHPFDLGAVDLARALILLTPDTSETQVTAHGLAVVATSRQTAASAAVAAALTVNPDGGGVAASISPVIVVMGGDTAATIDNALIDTRLGSYPHSASDIAVIAGSHSFSENLVIGVAGSTGISGAGALGNTTMSRQTDAHIQGATVGNQIGPADVGAVTVKAGSSEDTVNVVAGLAAGYGAGTGSVIVNVFSGDTTASVDRGALNAASLAVTAGSSTDMLNGVGAFAIGNDGIAGAFNVAVVQGRTVASIGDADDDTAISLAGSLAVSALARDSQKSLVVGGALAGDIAVAGMADVSVSLSETRAGLYRAEVSGASDVSVTARQDLVIIPITGGVAAAVIPGTGAGIGVGASANVVVLRSAVIAETVASTIGTSGAVLIDAEANKDIYAVTATAGVGTSLGIGASVAVILAGVDAPGDALAELDKNGGGTLTKVNSASNTDASNASAQDKPGYYDASGDTKKNLVSGALASNALDQVTARMVGGEVTAASLTVSSQGLIATSNQAYGLAVGGGAGIGAAVAYTRVYDTVTASVSGVATVGALAVSAGAGDLQNRAISNEPAHMAEVRAAAGAGGLLAGIGAAVAISDVQNTVTAKIDGAVTGTNAGTATLEASDTGSANSEAYGATVGGLAIGVSVATAEKTSTVSAQIGDSSQVEAFDGVSVHASARGTITATGVAGAGGLAGAGTGVGVTATDTSRVSATVGDFVTLIAGAQGLSLLAEAMPATSAIGTGVAVSGGGAVGVSVALATASATTTATIGAYDTINAGSLSVRALVNLDGGNEAAYTRAVAGSGAIFVALQATDSEAKDTSKATASIGDLATITLTGDATVEATTSSKQAARSIGVSVGGLLALGANIAKAQSDSTTIAVVGDNVKIMAANLTVHAAGSDSNDASAISGAGGLIAGSVAVATTSAKALTSATVGTGNANRLINVSSGLLKLLAEHTARTISEVDSVNAGVVGASGAGIGNTIDSTVLAALADDAYVRGKDLSIQALNTAQKFFLGEQAYGYRAGQPVKDANYNPDDADWNINSGSGGVLNLPAGVSQTDISLDTSATIGRNADVHLLPVNGGNSLLTVEAYNEIVGHDKAKLDSGGLIALADAETAINVKKANATVSFGDGAQIILDTGDIRAAAWANADLDIRSAATTYGLAGAPIGHADLDYHGLNTLSVGNNVRLEANSLLTSAGTITLAAGAGLDGASGVIIANATVDLYNKTIIPIDVTPNPHANIDSNSNLTIAYSPLRDSLGNATNLGVRSAGDINLIATKGDITAKAKGTGKDIYREALAKIASAFSHLFGGGDVTFDYHGGSTSVTGLGTVTVDGIVQTGISRTRILTLDYALENVGTCLVASRACLAAPIDGQIGYTVQDGVPIGTLILQRIDELTNLLSAYGADPVAAGAYTNEINFLQTKLVALGLASGDPNSTNYNPGAFSEPSPRAVAQADLIVLQQQRNGLGSTFDASATTVVNTVSTARSSTTTIATTVANTVQIYGTNANTGVASQTSQILSIASGLTKYDANDATTQAQTSQISTLTSANNQLRSDIQSLTGANTTLQTAIDNANASIQSSQQTIASVNNQIANLPYGTQQSAVDQLNAQADQARATIAANTQTISSAQAQIKTNGDAVQAKTQTLNANLQTINADLQSIVTRSADTSKNGDNTKLGQINPLLSANASAQGTIGGYASTIVSTVGDLGTALSTLSTAAQTIGNYVTAGQSLDQQIAQAIATIPTLSDATPNGPTTSAVTVDNAVARLGDIYVKADRFVGSGIVAAPGDASISITNNTAATLIVQNLTILSDSGGRLRLNGVLVNNNDDINKLNQGGATANFAQVTTATSQGAPLPTITIANKYSTNSLTYYDPGYTGPLYYLSHPQPAPDLQTASNTVINNLRGAVIIRSEQGNIYSNGTINAGAVDIQAKNGDFVQGYVYGFDHIGGDPASNAPLGRGIIANGSIFIAARYLNINSLIQSGIAQWTLDLPIGVTLTASATQLGLDQSIIDQAKITYENLFAADPNTSPIISLGNGIWFNATAGAGGAGRIEFTTAYAIQDASTAAGHARTNGVYSLIDAYGNIGVSYDANLNRYVVDGTEVRGGSIQLYGQILNTSASAGQLKVLDGYGQIAITNADPSRTVVIGKLDTGQDPTNSGRGVQGKIDITDIYNVATGDPARPVSAVHTVYTRDFANGQYAVNAATEYGYLDPQGTFVANSTGFRPGSDRSAYYDPQLGLRYVYTTGVDYSVKQRIQYKGTQFLGQKSWRTKPSDSVEKTYDPVVLNSYRLSDGTYLNKDASSTGITEIDNTTTYADTANAQYVKVKEWTSCNWWTLCIAQNYHYIVEVTTPKTDITSHSLKGDNRIGIEFIGADSGTVTVNSKSDVVLTGQINNKVGQTVVVAGTAGEQTAHSILQGNDSALISSKAVSLVASGSVGSLNGGAGSTPAPVKVSITPGGAFNATARNGNVVVSSDNTLPIGSVTASGDVTSMLGRVVLSAGGDIVGVSSGSLISAPRVELTSLNGAIGATANPLRIDVGYTDDPNLRPFGDPAKGAVLNTYYGLKASAAGDIGITTEQWALNTSGNLLVDQVTSLGGNVRLVAPGAILDNNPAESIDTRTYQQLLNYWNSLALLSGSAANQAKQVAQVNAYESTKTANYDQYWAIRQTQSDGGAAYDPSFHYVASASERSALAQQYRTLDPTLSDAQVSQKIADYEASRTSTYAALNGEVGSLTTSFVSTYRYVASDAEKAAITHGAGWTERELAFSISPGALKTITSTNPVVKSANVVGRTVTLEAGNAIGETEAAIVIPTDIEPRNLTDAQKVALAAAERSDLTLTDDTITITPRRPFNADALTALNVSVAATPQSGSDRGNAYLASQKDALLGIVSVPGEARIKVGGSILNAPASAVNTGNLILEAANGGVGVTRDPVSGALQIEPLRISPSAGATIIARGNLGVYLDVAGSASVDTIYSPQDVQVKAAGSILNANGDQLINILGDFVTLTAVSGSIGAKGDPLNVGDALDGGISAQAARDVFLFGPIGNTFRLDAVDAGGTVSLAAEGDGIVNGPVHAIGSASFSAGAEWLFTGTAAVLTTAGNVGVTAQDLRMLVGATIEASGSIGINVGNDAQVTGLLAHANVLDAISIIAGDKIISGNGSDLTTATPGAGIRLFAGNGIGDASRSNGTAVSSPVQSGIPAPLTLDTSAVDAETVNGSLYLRTLSPILSATLKADHGGIGITADKDFHAVSATAPFGPIAITGAAGLVIDTATSGGTQSFSAVNDLRFLTLTTTGTQSDPGDVNLVSSAGRIIGGSIFAHGSIFMNGRAIRFDEIIAGQNIQLTAAGDIIGTHAKAGADLGAESTENGTIEIDDVEAARMSFASAGSLIFKRLTVDQSITLAANTIQVGTLRQSPAGAALGPLLLNLTGYKGAVGSFASLFVDAVAGLHIGDLRFADTVLTTTAGNVTIDRGYVTGTLSLTTPYRLVFMNNRSPLPLTWPNVQLFQPTYAFMLDQYLNRSYTDSYVVRYSEGSDIHYLVGPYDYRGYSFVRDFDRAMRNGDPELYGVFDDGSPAEQQRNGRLPPIYYLRLPNGAIQRLGNGPAVNLGRN